MVYFDNLITEIPVKNEEIMAPEKQKPRNLREIKEIRPIARGRNIMEGQDFSNLNAMLMRIKKQKETKKK